MDDGVKRLGNKIERDIWGDSPLFKWGHMLKKLEPPKCRSIASRRVVEFWNAMINYKIVKFILSRRTAWRLLLKVDRVGVVIDCELLITLSSFIENCVHQ